MDVFSVRKAFLGGAGVTAAALLVMSAAWACSPYGIQSSRDIAHPDDGPVTMGPAGTELEVQGRDYEEQYGKVTIAYSEKGSDVGTTLLREVELVHDKDEMRWDNRLRVDRLHHLYKFEAQVKVPEDAVYPGRVYVYQWSAQGDMKAKNEVFAVAPRTTATTVASTIAPLPTATTVPTPQTPAVTVVPSPTLETVAPTPQAILRTDAVRPSRQRDDAPARAVVTVVGGGASVGRSELPITQVAGTPDRFEVAPWMDPPQLDVQTLWSGLAKREGPSAASLTGPTQPPERGPSMVGAVLLTLGALLLLTGGLVAVPRRRALVRIR